MAVILSRSDIHKYNPSKTDFIDSKYGLKHAIAEAKLVKEIADRKAALEAKLSQEITERREEQQKKLAEARVAELAGTVAPVRVGLVTESN